MLGIGIGLRLPLQGNVLAGGAPPAANNLLLETGGTDYLLLENGDELQLE